MCLFYSLSVVWEIFWKLPATCDGSLLRPSLANILTAELAHANYTTLHCVATTTDQHHRDIETPDITGAFRVTIEGKVEASQLVSGQGIGTKLKNDGTRTESLDNLLDHWLKDGVVRGIGDTITQGHVDSVALSTLDSGVLDVRDLLQLRLTRTSPVPGKNSPKRWNEAVITRSVV